MSSQFKIMMAKLWLFKNSHYPNRIESLPKKKYKLKATSKSTWKSSETSFATAGMRHERRNPLN